ncbi:MAG: biopolymer transporter ExbD [Endomicrobiaceae bacterium]
MDSFKLERRKKTDTNLNIAPLIDIVFLLLIFFILSSHLISHKGFKINLPDASAARTQKNGQTTVFINKSGKILLDGIKVTVDGLKPLLKNALTKIPSNTVVIKADENICLGLGVKVMDIAKEAGAGGIIISTEKNCNEKNK